MPSTPLEVVTMTLCRYQGFSSRWWAFTQMGRGMGPFADTPGLKTVKLLGSGARNGFSIWPNFGVYALLGVWEDKAAADAFFSTHAWWRQAEERSCERLTVYMYPCAAHGQWAGEEPFHPQVPFVAEAPLAVITRATIRPRHVWRFWREVPRVSAAIENRPGELLSIGVGEYPLFMQATFSLWSSAQAMLDYAYHSAEHREMVRKTREIGWYQEELFARFRPYRTEGQWEGRRVEVVN